MKIDLGVTLPEIGENVLYKLLINVCNECNVSVSDVVSTKRNVKLVKARATFAQKARYSHIGATLMEIGDVINRDHSTIFHYLNDYKPPLSLED